MRSIKIIFFDLDNTLFNHSRAEKMALRHLVRTYPELFKHTSEEKFLETYDTVNKLLWKKMAEGAVTAQELKRRRFALSIGEENCTPEWADKLSELYLQTYSGFGFSFPNAHETLAYLQPSYQLAILSNGFPAIQEQKLANTELGSYFKVRLYSSDLGVMKPDPEIFQRAMQQTQFEPDEVAYIGDSYEDDIRSSKGVGWLAIHFNPRGTFQENGLADYEITDLSELRDIF